MDLQSVLNYQLLPFRGCFQIKDLHFPSELLNLSTGGNEIVSEFLYHFRTILNDMLELLNLLHLHSKSLLEGSQMRGLFVAF